jgi:DNA ligase (NAD+)
MTQDEARVLIKELSDKLRVNSYNYYVKSQPTIPDSEYDAMFNYLKKLEEEFPSLRLPDSPTQKIGSDLDVTSGFTRLKHIKPVLSLANAFGDEDLRSWTSRNKNRTDPKNDRNVFAESIEYILEPKLDGLTLVVTYEKGILTKAVTRGTGEEGDDVTANAKTIRNLPLRIGVNSDGEVENAPEMLVIRGEVLFTEADFKRFNDWVIAQGEESYVNARNAASGSLKQKYPTITAARPLSFFAYDIMHISGNYMPKTHSEALDYLNRMGLKAVGFSRLETGIDAVIVALQAWQNYRNSFGFETDGVVIKINGIHLNDSLGFSGKDPRGSIAYKFQAEETATTLKDVVWTVGRSGRLTPNAVLEPVFSGG